MLVVLGNMSDDDNIYQKTTAMQVRTKHIEYAAVRTPSLAMLTLFFDG